jgi:hypothetical protein
MSVFNRLLAILVLSMTFTSAALAQSVLIPGALNGPGAMGPGGARRLCSPLAIGLVEWRIAWITGLLKPNDGQELLLRQLADVSLQAKQAIAAGCAESGAVTTATQLDRMERRLEGLAAAVALLQPSYDQFYAALDEHQRARLEALGPARSGWRW